MLRVLLFLSEGDGGDHADHALDAVVLFFRRRERKEPEASVIDVRIDQHLAFGARVRRIGFVPELGALADLALGGRVVHTVPRSVRRIVVRLRDADLDVHPVRFAVDRTGDHTGVSGRSDAGDFPPAGLVFRSGETGRERERPSGDRRPVIRIGCEEFDAVRRFARIDRKRRERAARAFDGFGSFS